MLQAEELSVSFRGGVRRRPIHALQGLTLRIGEGEFFALLGQNGAGKSTAMYAFLGLLRPTSGRVRLFGETPRPGAPTFARIGYLPEEPQYHGYLTVGEALDYYAALHTDPLGPKERLELLERLDLAEARDLRVAKCSKGMKQKLGIAQCLVNRPTLLFLDEPMRGLDPLAVKTFREMLVEIHRQGATVIVNSHIMAEVELVATRAAILGHGRLIADDTIENLTRLAEDVYEVVFEGPDGGPLCLAGAAREGIVTRGTVLAPALPEFLAFAAGPGITLVSLHRKRATLEESFEAIVKGSDGHV
jgi:ABC-2 type transport system ATP-binding protein